MAGIGFTLRKLAARDDLIGVARALTHSTFASAGPWLFTVATIAAITMLYSDYFAPDQLVNFRVIVIYNFAFSLVLSAPVFMVITRHLADYIHFKDVTRTPSVLIGSLVLLLIIESPITGWFYFHYTILPLGLRLSAFVNVFLITAVWLISIYLTALKDYRAITWSYLAGMIIAVFCGLLLKQPYGDTGMLSGFNIGLSVIVFSLAANVFAEYPYSYEKPFSMMYYFRKYWELAVAGIFYNAAIWVDKWIMWFAPESWVLPSKMRMYPDYDGAMFFAYLTIIPSLATFVFSVETNFFERYRKFYNDILEHAPLKKIYENHGRIIDSVIGSARNFVIVQGTLSLLAVVLAPKIFDLLNINYTQIGIFRLGVIGAFFHVLALFGQIILSYFDHRRTVMWIQGFFLVANTVITLYVMLGQSHGWPITGFPFYGYGYFLSSLLTFVITTWVLFSHMRELPYHAFITSNTSVNFKGELLTPEEEHAEAGVPVGAEPVRA